jgi:hypothetical protein
MMQRDVIVKTNRTAGTRAHSHTRPSKSLAAPAERQIACPFCGTYRQPLKGTTDVLGRHKQSDRMTPCLLSLAALEAHQADLHAQHEENRRRKRQEERDAEYLRIISYGQ